MSLSTETAVAAPSAPPDATLPSAAWRRLALFLAAAQCLALVLLGAMLLNKHRSLLTDLTLSRIEIQAGDLDGALRTGVMTGLMPGEIHGLDDLVKRLKAADPSIAAIEVVASDQGTAQVVFAAAPDRLGARLDAEEWRAMTTAQGFRRSQPAAGPMLEAAVRDAADAPVGGLRVSADPAPLARAAEAMGNALWPQIGATLAAMLLATLAALAWLRPRGSMDGGALRRRVMTVALLTTLAAGGHVAWRAEQLLADGLTPAVAAKVDGVADFLAAKVARAAALGIPLDKLPGVADYFAGLMARHPEVAALRLAGADGAILARHGAAAGPWTERAAGPGRIAVAADQGFVTRRLGELAADVAIVLLVAVLVFRELLAALLGALPAAGAAASAASAADRLRSLRLPLFLFILTEEMSRAFLPLYLQSFARGATFLGRETETGLPIALYMLCFALATPFAGRWADRWGVARVFGAGVAMTLAGFAWTALAGSYWELLPARALCAWGYATGTMACQRQLILLTGPAERARGLALFVGAVGIAAICGSALGGVLADQFGFRPVFAVSALLALAAWAAFRLTQGRSNDHGEESPPLRWAEIARLMRDRRFAALMLGGAIPAKIALAGFLFYLTPLALHRLDYSPAAIGRAVMLYFVLVAAINPMASWLSDRLGWRLSLTLAGGALIGLGGLAGLAIEGEAAVWLGIAALGVGTGMATAPMQALASEIGERAGATSVAVVLRTLERLGSVAGPLWAGAWLAAAGWNGAMAAIGLAVLAGTLLCLAARQRKAP